MTSNNSNILNLNTVQTMSSLEISKLCEKQHKHVLIDIDKMLSEIYD